MTSIEKINELLKLKGISANKMMCDLGFSSGLFSQWKKGMQKPSIDKLTKIAEYFNVSINEIIDSEGSTEVNNDIILFFGQRPELQLLVETAKTSTESEVKTYIRVIKALQEGE